MEDLVDSASKRAKTEDVDSINGEDRLSDLSNDVLHHIFRFLNPKYSVQASVLGKRWRHVWRSLPNLDFQSDNPPQKSFVGFLNQVLILPSDTPVVDIQSFKLCYIDEAIACDVYSTWVLAATRRNVATLVIKLPLEKGPVQLHSCLFTCKSLVDLDLGFGRDFPQLVLPSLVDLPKLKYLRLSNVTLVDDDAVSSLISSCPSLENLVMVVGRDSLRKYVVNAPKLRSLLVMRYCKDVENSEIKLFAPNLITFYGDNRVTREPSFNKPYRLMNANIGIFHDVPLKAMAMPEYRRKRIVQSAARLAELVGKVRSLVLCGWMVEAAFELPTMMETRFHNLEHLTLVHVWLSRDSVLATMNLLKISPNVRTLFLQIRKYDTSQQTRTCNEEQFIPANMEECWDLGISKECFLRHLEVVTIRGVIGCVNEFKLLEFLLNNAVALEQLTINGKSPNRENGFISFKKKVMEIPRASPKVSIFFF